MLKSKTKQLATSIALTSNVLGACHTHFDFLLEVRLGTAPLIYSCDFYELHLIHQLVLVSALVRTWKYIACAVFSLKVIVMGRHRHQRPICHAGICRRGGLAMILRARIVLVTIVVPISCATVLNPWLLRKVRVGVVWSI